ncbi:MAG: hypothetical protein KGL39_41285 [Patescibacteria group bacterium]|nr:hypothetical protein [Patescibacteria group bacterium]
MSKAGAGNDRRNAARNLDEFGGLLAQYKAVLVKHGLTGSEIRALLITFPRDFLDRVRNDMATPTPQPDE